MVAYPVEFAKAMPHPNAHKLRVNSSFKLKDVELTNDVFRANAITHEERGSKARPQLV